MKNINEVFETMKDILSSEMGEKKVYDKDLAKALGLHQMTLATMKKRGKLPYDKVLDFCAKRKISINWLLYGQVVESIRDETEKFARIRYFNDIYASAGGGALNYDEENEYINVDKKILEHLGRVDTKEIDAINVIGESMEPTLKEGSVVFVDKSDTNIKKGGIFILSTNDGLFIKRVLYRVDGSCDIISDNPVYPPQRMPAGSFEIIGKVIGTVSKLSS
jgi:SOS-response transcriptional repressor LexA